MKNFKIKDLMISIHPHFYSGKQYINDHFKMGDPAPDCMGSVSKCGKTKEDCVDTISKCGKTKEDCTDTVSSCKQTKTGPDYYDANPSMLQDEQSTYSKDLWNLKQALARMKAKELPL